MQNKKVDMNFYLNESILYYKGIRNRIVKLDDDDEAKNMIQKKLKNIKTKLNIQLC